MISIAAHLIFVWILNLAMQAPADKGRPAEIPPTQQEMKKEEGPPPAPAAPDIPPTGHL